MQSVTESIILALLTIFATLPSSTFVDGRRRGGRVLRCFACTNYDHNDHFSLEIADPNWIRWLRTISPLPRSPNCALPAKDETIRVWAEDCPNGVCAVITLRHLANSSERSLRPFRPTLKHDQILRTCLLNAKQRLTNNCTTLDSKPNMELEICTCDGVDCDERFSPQQANQASLIYTRDINISGIFVIMVIYFACLFGSFT